MVTLYFENKKLLINPFAKHHTYPLHIHTHMFNCHAAFSKSWGLWEFLGGNSVTSNYNVLFSVNSQSHVCYRYPWQRLLIIPQHPFSLIIWSRIFLWPGFSKAHHRSGRDYIFQPVLHPDMTIWLSSGQGYLRGSNVCNFWVMSFKKKAFFLYVLFLTFCWL